MAPSPSHRLAASLATALLTVSCSTPTEVATDANQPVPAATQPAPTPSTEPAPAKPTQPSNETAPAEQSEPPAAQPQPSKPLTIAEQRAAALAEHWLQSARKLRANGDLARAYAELVQAERAAPDNQAVAAEMAELLKVYTPDKPAVRKPAVRKPSPRMSRIAQQRAVAMVEYQLRTALQRTAQKDYDGALEQLREAEQGIARHKTIDWGDLEAKIRAAQADAKRRKGGNE